MKTELDKTIDAAYIYIADEIKNGEVKKTYPCDVRKIGFMLNIDFDYRR